MRITKKVKDQLRRLLEKQQPTTIKAGNRTMECCSLKEVNFMNYQISVDIYLTGLAKFYMIDIMQVRVRERLIIIR